MNDFSFVDRDTVVRYLGGGIGHLKNAPPLQVPGFDPIDPSSEEMEVEDDDDNPCSGTNEDLGAVVQQPSRDVAVNGGELVHFWSLRRLLYNVATGSCIMNRLTSDMHYCTIILHVADTWL